MAKYNTMNEMLELPDGTATGNGGAKIIANFQVIADSFGSTPSGAFPARRALEADWALNASSAEYAGYATCAAYAAEAYRAASASHAAYAEYAAYAYGLPSTARVGQAEFAQYPGYASPVATTNGHYSVGCAPYPISVFGGQTAASWYASSGTSLYFPTTSAPYNDRMLTVPPFGPFMVKLLATFFDLSRGYAECAEITICGMNRTIFRVSIDGPYRSDYADGGSPPDIAIFKTWQDSVPGTPSLIVYINSGTLCLQWAGDSVTQRHVALVTYPQDPGDVTGS